MHPYRVGEEVRVVQLLERTLLAMGHKTTIGKFNDTHSLKDVRELVQRAIAAAPDENSTNAA
jgi:hypothetical protein